MSSSAAQVCLILGSNRRLQSEESTDNDLLAVKIGAVSLI